MIYTLAMICENYSPFSSQDPSEMVGVTYYPLYTDTIIAGDFISFAECYKANPTEPHIALAEWLKSGKIFFGTFDQMLDLRHDFVEACRSDRKGLKPTRIEEFGYNWTYRDYANLQIVAIDDIWNGPIGEYGYKILCEQLEFPFDEDYL